VIFIFTIRIACVLKIQKIKSNLYALGAINSVNMRNFVYTTKSKLEEKIRLRFNEIGFKKGQECKNEVLEKRLIFNCRNTKLQINRQG